MASHDENQVGEIVAEESGNQVLVEIERHSACKKCGACDFGMSGNKTSQLELENTVNAGIGDKVVIDMEGKDIVKASVLIYLVPLFSLVVGLLLGTLFADSLQVDENILGFVLGIVFMGITYGLLKRYDNKIRFERPDQYKPKIVKKVN